MIRENILSVRNELSRAAAAAGTPLDQLRLVAVTKTVDVSRITEALNAGITEIGENRVQELCKKAPALALKPTLHLIGHLQTNKARDAVCVADCIHSVDSLHLAQELQKQCKKIGKRMPILLQVNTSGEESKFGISPEGLFSLAEAVLSMPNLEIRGLMTIAPMVEHPAHARPIFSKTRELYSRMAETFAGDVRLDMLSMGMSNDYVEAVLEGATVVRIGRGIFGERV